MFRYCGSIPETTEQRAWHLSGAERYGLRVKDLARAIHKSPQGVTRALARGARRRASDAAFRKDLDGVDKVLAEGCMGEISNI